jgi:hypothetical protein
MKYVLRRNAEEIEELFVRQHVMNDSFGTPAQSFNAYDSQPALLQISQEDLEDINRHTKDWVNNNTSDSAGIPPAVSGDELQKSPRTN